MKQIVNVVNEYGYDIIDVTDTTVVFETDTNVWTITKLSNDKYALESPDTVNSINLSLEDVGEQLEIIDE